MSLSRVIEVSFNGGSIAYVKADTAYFYNNGIIFKPTDIDLPASYQVHWADSPQASSTLETIGTAEGAPIPDDLWSRSRVIYGWIYLHPTEDSGVTGYEVRIYKNVRAGLPNGTEPTPAEQSTIDQLIGALNSAVEQTGEDAESADQSARSAESAKTAAESARDTAGEYANDAESSAASASTSASQASASATTSAQSASQSAQIKADVEDLVDDAQGYASASAQSASQASASEQGCARAVLDAASAAAISRARADEASSYAQTASQKASEASGYADTSSQKASESAQSASLALGYKNDALQAKTSAQTAQGLAESARDSAISAKTDAESAKADAESARDEAVSAVASIGNALAEKAPIITDTASGSIASFSDGADDLPLKSLVIDINPVQDLSHGDPSPENICPISGWTGVKVTRTGKNFLALPIEFRANLNVSQLFFIKKGSYKLRFSGMTNATSWRTGVWMKDANGNDLSDITHKPYAYYSWYASAGYWMDGANGARNEFDITIAEDCYIKFFFVLGDTSASTVCNDAQLELGSTATPYSPYTGRSITINLGQTVYGGKLDVLSGVLTVDRDMVDLGTLSWITPNENRFYTTSLSSVIKKGTDGALWIQSSMFRATSALRVVYNSLDAMWLSASGNISISKIADTAAALKTAVTGQQLVYKLATPIEIQLSANQVNSLLGVNNIWADSGDTSAEYRADTKAYIAKKIAEALASLT